MSRSGSYLAPPGFRDSSSPALNHGEVVASTYAIRHEIARTDTGVVFEARDMMMDRPVALKLAWRDAGTPSMILEARRCAAVHDPCAVAIYGMGSHNSAEYVVAERIEGMLLRELVGTPAVSDAYLGRVRALVAAVTRSHEAGIAVGDISGATVLVDDDNRMVLGRLSLSQIPAFGPHGQILAPEVVRGEVEASDPSAAEAIDLYGLGCIAIELARGEPPFAHRDPSVELRGHAYEAPPRLADLRPDIPGELSDLVEWLLAKVPVERPRSARDVLEQIDAIIERLGIGTRSLRVLIVDDDTSRARLLWSLARRAHARTIVEISSDGSDAAHKLNRDKPDLVFVDASLRGVMNAFELCMYARGLEGLSDERAQLALLGDPPERDRVLFADVDVPILPDDHRMAAAVLDRVRAAMADPPRRRRPKITVSG